ncbi:MAG: hypothetical protein CR982_00895 [Candidatus Cloacimonadota bacterium]|nr:MAG: hypothetical protein CR982_00895 [Candidatus Cloacimonadota bacterium]PIE78413.1 MAG: hypothetical protein CSA15_08045 [Candidatus Delongbacteria bacterium]
MIKFKLILFLLILATISTFFSCSDSSKGSSLIVEPEDSITYDDPNTSTLNLSLSKEGSNILLKWDSLNIEGFQEYKVSRSWEEISSGGYSLYTSFFKGFISSKASSHP